MAENENSTWETEEMERFILNDEGVYRAALSLVRDYANVIDPEELGDYRADQVITDSRGTHYDAHRVGIALQNEAARFGWIAASGIHDNNPNIETVDWREVATTLLS